MRTACSFRTINNNADVTKDAATRARASLAPRVRGIASQSKNQKSGSESSLDLLRVQNDGSSVNENEIPGSVTLFSVEICNCLVDQQA
jgi:hypothetical protein